MFSGMLSSLSTAPNHTQRHKGILTDFLEKLAFVLIQAIYFKVDVLESTWLRATLFCKKINSVKGRKSNDSITLVYFENCVYVGFIENKKMLGAPWIS